MKLILLLFQNVTDEDSMVVQHILAVRKGTRDITNLNKDDKNTLSDNESIVKKENEEVKKEEEEEEEEEKSDDKIDKSPEKKPDETSEEKSEVKPDDKSDVIKTEQEEEPTKSEESKEKLLDETEDSSKKTIEVDEYYVKYRNFSYLHCEWKTEEELTKGDKRIAAKLKRFKQKMANNTNIFENVSHYKCN